LNGMAWEKRERRKEERRKRKTEKNVGGKDAKKDAKPGRRLSLRRRAATQRASDAGDGVFFVFAGERVFPDAQDAPVSGAEEAVHFAVALAVAGDFVAPEFPVARGHPAMFRASVPEAAVDKNREPPRGKNKIGLARQFAAPPPAGDAVRAENGDEAQFGVLVAAGADAGHNLRTFIW